MNECICCIGAEDVNVKFVIGFTFCEINVSNTRFNQLKYVFPGAYNLPFGGYGQI